MRPSLKAMSDLVVKAIVWNVWLARNDCIFNANAISAQVILLKVDCMLLSWFSAVPNATKEKLVDSMTTIRRSLDFIGPRVESPGGASLEPQVQTRVSDILTVWEGAPLSRRELGLFSLVLCFCCTIPSGFLFCCLVFGSL